MVVSTFGVAALAGLIALAPVVVVAQGASAANAAPPDFSGVYYTQSLYLGLGQRVDAGPPPRPTSSSLVSDGSQGRAPGGPSLTPEYMAKWEMMRKSRIAGSSEFDNIAKCLPPGMPAMMNMFFGMEVMQVKDRITFFSEWNDALRRVYLDGRKPTQKVLDDPTYAGYSTGHWEGDTLVVDTVALHPNSFIEGFTPHSEAITVKERIRFIGPGALEDRITVTDPVALTKPWETVHTYQRARPGNDELREFACAEGLGRAK